MSALEALAELVGQRDEVAQQPLDDGALAGEIRLEPVGALLEVREGLDQAMRLLGLQAAAIHAEASRRMG